MSPWESAPKGFRTGLEDIGESPVNRMKSYFAKGTCKPGQRADLSGCTPAEGPTNHLPQSNADSKLKRILSFMAGIPRAIVQRVKSAAVAKYHKLEQRYGSKYAKMIIVAALAGLPLPIPGSMAITAAPVLAVAEMHRLASSMLSKSVTMSQEEIAAAAEQLIAELTQEFTEGPEKHHKLLVTKIDKPRDFSSTQIQLPKEVGKRLLELAANIANEDLANDGREDDAHVTVKYGLHTNDPEVVRDIVSDFGPVQLSFGPISIFPAKEGMDYDVVKVEVISPRLHALNELLADAIPHTDTHPVYKPHATIAYVKSGLGEKYIGASGLESVTVSVRDLIFSDQNSNKTVISLGSDDRSIGPLNQLPKSIAKAAGTCEPGQTAANTGCTPASGQGSKNPATSKPSKTEPEPKASGVTAQAKKIVKKIKPSKERAFVGKPTGGKISKQLAGAIGEEIAVQHLKSLGFKDASNLADYLKEKRNNLPADVIQDHEIIEVKAGQSSNGPKAQQWRLTIGEPGEKEKAWLAKASPKAKARFNAQKQKLIHERKQKAIKEVSDKLGYKVGGKTITVIINHDTRKADVYMFDGFHDRIGWTSDMAKKGYVRSVSYG